jgi:hypothetical protein
MPLLSAIRHSLGRSVCREEHTVPPTTARWCPLRNQSDPRKIPIERGQHRDARGD